ncbi:MAG: hypothetical protein IKE41_02435 [Clostridia bacterium]|nr:hypothetical protein [Clostridia bacterium]
MPNPKSAPTSISFEYGNNKSATVVSNWTDFTNIESVSLSKSCLSDDYFFGDNITYIVDIKNNSDMPLFNIKIKENMGKPKSENNTDSHAPLKYTGNFRYYLNGNLTELTEPKIYSDKIIFEIDLLPAFSSASIIYSAEITANAPIEVKSSITNSSSLIVASNGETLESSHTIKVKEIADIKTIKQTKNFYGGGLTYSIFIYNYGNLPAKNVVIKDKLEHTSSNLTVKVGSKTLGISDYSVNSNDLQIPSYGSKYSLSVPEAKFIEDKTSGKFTVVPGVVELSIECKV